MTWKYFWTWLLLLTVSLQWIGGLVYVRLSYVTLVEQAMDEGEARLAARLSVEYDMETQVNILDEAERQSLVRLGYGAPFIFSESIDGRRDHFTLESSGLKVSHSDYLINGPEKQRESEKALLNLDHHFSPYIVDGARPAAPPAPTALSGQAFLYDPLKDLFFLAIPTPPPNFLV